MNVPADLRKIPLLASLREADLAALAQNLHTHRAAEGDILIREGERGEALLIILDGEVEVIKSLGTGDDRTLGRHGVGEFIGEMSMLERDGIHTASVRASSDVRLLELNHRDFDSLLLRAPSTAIQLLRELSHRLRQSNEETMRDLLEKNRQLGVAYEQLKAAQAQIIEKEKLERELQVARRIQESMLPSKLPELPGFDFGARIFPARAVGGDLYDVFKLDDRRVAVVIGDVSDKGVPAALFMAQARSLVRAVAMPDKSPAQVIESLNSLLLGMNAMGLFITMVYGIMDRERGNFTFSRAGHEVPLLYDASGTAVPVDPGKGRLLGILPDVRPEQQTVSLPPGAVLFLFTDGAADAIDGCGVRFGYERLEATVCAWIGGSAQALCDRVLAVIQSYQSEAPQADDITLVAVKAK